jgi:hypothetical protein
MVFNIKGLYTQGRQSRQSIVYPSDNYLAFIDTFIEVDLPTGTGLFSVVLAAGNNYFEPELRRICSYDTDDRRFLSENGVSSTVVNLLRFCVETHRMLKQPTERRKIGKLIRPTLTEITQLQQFSPLQPF